MIDPQLGTDMLRPSEVDVGERCPREYGSDQRHERQRLDDDAALAQRGRGGSSQPGGGFSAV